MSDNDARAYWTEQMDAAFAFMEGIRKYPLQECGEPLVSLSEAADGLEVEFSTTLINNTHPRVYSIRSGLTQSICNVAREMNERGWILKVEDGYRSPEMQRAMSHNPAHFDAVLEKAIWELDGKIPEPEFMLRRMTAVIATRARIGTHISGSAIDISVLNRDTGEELDRGGAYIEISTRTPMRSPFITSIQRQNREEITAIFHRHGWHAYPYEFWHYSSGDSYAESLAASGKAARYGPVRFDGKTSEPIDLAESDALIEPLAFYEKEINAALDRLKNGAGRKR